MHAINEDEEDGAVVLPSIPIKNNNNNHSIALSTNSKKLSGSGSLAGASLSNLRKNALLKSRDIGETDFEEQSKQVFPSSPPIHSSNTQNAYNPFAPPSGKTFNSNDSLRRSNETMNEKTKLDPIAYFLQRRASIGGRRASISAPGRRGSIVPWGQTRQAFDEDQLKYFWANRGLTLQDIETAFEFLSHDKQKLTHSDIKIFISTYFDTFPEEAISILNSWKEEVTMNQLEEVLLNKQLMTSPYESAFKWFQPENGYLGKSQLKRIAKSVSGRKLAGKNDVKHILSTYDHDRDNLIGLDDFKKMGLY